MGIVKISENLHEEIRKSSGVMSRSINSQAEFWMKMGMLSELNPNLTYAQIIQQQLKEQAFDMSRCDLEVIPNAISSEKKAG
ncbi:MAG: ParD-like family protein [Oleispira sp.]|nr:ParD-like family protein [Oleispira sp.]MBL4879957.1 ParD-like family protein [Oleispira sp.]